MVNHHGTLWVVKTDMPAIASHSENIGERKVIIEKGEILEWRYESDNHFRTIDDKWFWVRDDVWNEHCLKIANIQESVCWNNIAKTEEIWRLRLFTWIENGREVYESIKESRIVLEHDEVTGNSPQA